MMRLQITTLYIFAAMALLVSCHHKDGQNHDHGNHHGEHTFEDMVDHLEDPERDEWQKPQEVLAFMGPLRGKKVLDIGAGTGYFSFPIVEKGAFVTAVDISSKSVNYIQERKEKLEVPDSLLQVKQIPPDDPLVQTGQFDIALIVNTYHHIENRVAYFTKVRKGLTKDGTLYVVDFTTTPSPVGPPVEMRIPAEKVVYELIQAGYKNIEVEPNLLKYQYIVKAGAGEMVN